MDQPRPPVSSIYPSPHLHPDDQLSRLRGPLTDAAGNSQLHTLAPTGYYQDDKGRQHRMDIRCPVTIPSNHPRETIGHTLDQRRRSLRRSRHQRYTENPIFHSHQYQNYRNRQNREGNSEEAKWPNVLEDAFLDALLEIPHMGRRKFSYRGKPYGRNELVKEYLWIAYCQSLPPGQTPDPQMRRTRKQVSSHIQVIKGFLKGHPSYHRLFPLNKNPKNGFEDSFKNDPCLRALSEGRLPTRKYEYSNNNPQTAVSHPASTKPVLFWLLITVDEAVYHQYTTLTSPRYSENLDSIPRWRQKFPYLEHLYSMGDLNCDIVHMDVSLDLMSTHAPEKAELRTRLEISIPGRDFEGCQWQTVTSLNKPSELYRDPIEDPPLEAKPFIADILSISDVETRIKVPFPAISWAHAFTSLTDLQLRYEDGRLDNYAGSGSVVNAGPAREFTERMSMYQEVQSSAGPDQPFVRRAIILWTFRKVKIGEPGETVWRYIDASPPRSSCMSPSPHISQQISASMNENFQSFLNSTPHAQDPSTMVPYVQSLSTPTTSAGLQSPFAPVGYSCLNQNYDMPHRISLDSSATLDSESTLVEESANIDSILSNTNINLGDYDQGTASWNLNHPESFGADSSWGNYANASTTPHLGWDLDKHQSWPDNTYKQNTWIADTHGKDDWSNAGPDKPEQASFDQSLTKLPTWLDQPVNEANNSYSETLNTSIPELIPGTVDTKDQSWHWE